jgi:hypothetical protein
MSRSTPLGGTALIDRIQAIVHSANDGRHLSGATVQDALIVVLAYVRAARDPSGFDVTAGHGLLGRIRALEAPLTDLLTQRIARMEPELPMGEALYAASIDARMIVAVALRAVGRG